MFWRLRGWRYRLIWLNEKTNGGVSNQSLKYNKNPFNKWKARKSVALGTPLREEEHVEKLLDLTNLLLYIRAKESVMGTDRFFFKKQIKL